MRTREEQADFDSNERDYGEDPHYRHDAHLERVKEHAINALGELLIQEHDLAPEYSEAKIQEHFGDFVSNDDVFDAAVAMLKRHLAKWRSPRASIDATYREELAKRGVNLKETSE